MKSKKEKHQEEKNIITETSTLAVVRYGSQFILAIRGFIIASFLGPSLYGLWNILKTIIDVAPHADLGAVKGMTREVPLNAGRNKEKDNIIIQQTAFSWQFMMSLLLAIVLFVGSFTNKVAIYRTEIQLVALVVLFTNTYYYLKDKLVSEKKIMRLSAIEISYALLNTVFGLGLLFFIEIKGLLLGMVISFIILFSISIRKKDITLAFGVRKKALKRLIKTGFPITVLVLSSILMHNIDKIVVFTLLGSVMTGYYGLAAFISLLINYIPQAMSTVLSPRMLHKYGRTNDKKQIQEYFTKPSILLANGMPILLGLIFINIPWIINLFLPQYIPSILTIQILTLSLFFSSIIKVPTEIIILFNKQSTLMYVQIGALIVGGLADIIVIKMGYGIVGVAIATAATIFVLSIITNTYCLRLLDMKKQVEGLWRVYSPFFYSLLILGAAHILLKELIFREVIQIISMSVLFVIGCTPLLLRIKKEGTIAKGLELIKKRMLKK